MSNERSPFGTLRTTMGTSGMCNSLVACLTATVACNRTVAPELPDPHHRPAARAAPLARRARVGRRAHDRRRRAAPDRADVHRGDLQYVHVHAEPRDALHRLD